jgi:putative component of membrane protein insertase Oxa1/YidC/SpoIIIJ protein YidD
MALGTREDEQSSLWIATSELPRSPGHPFYRRLNALLDAHDFDRFVEGLCRKFYATRQVSPFGVVEGVWRTNPRVTRCMPAPFCPCAAAAIRGTPAPSSASDPAAHENATRDMRHVLFPSVCV